MQTDKRASIDTSTETDTQAGHGHRDRQGDGTAKHERSPDEVYQADETDRPADG